MSGYHQMNQPLQGNCRVCGGMLAKEVTTLENIRIGTQGEEGSRVAMIEALDYFGYVNAPLVNQTKSVTKVWCTACGLLYNPQ
jgi:hypothetical protein